MRKYGFLLIMLPVLLLVGCGGQAAQPEVVMVEIAYLNHPPVRPILAEVDDLLASYGEQVNVARYDFGTPEGEAFAEDRKLTGHTPLAIFVNGSMDFTVEGRTVKFYSFPQGQGTGVVPDGAWTVAALKQVVDQATGNQP